MGFIGKKFRRMRSVFKRSKISTVAKSYVTSYFDSRREEGVFKGVSTYCMFVGYGRSGHSLVGSLIDAHPDAIIAPELNVLKYLRLGFSKKQIYSLILRRSRLYAEKKKRPGSKGYHYKIPNQWQGKYRELLVIGDKKGAGSSAALERNPGLLDKLRKKIDADIKFIHVLRNPYDNITTMSLISKAEIGKAIRRYFSRCETITRIKKFIEPSSFFEIRHESIIADPEGSLRRICGFLNLEPLEDYIKDCASIIYTKPHRSRYKITWTDELIGAVANRIAEFPFLQGYSFED